MKMARIRLVASLGVVLSILAGLSPATATEEDRRLRRGAFLGAHFVYAIPDFDIEGGLTTDDPLGFEVFAGYRFNRYVSLEGQFLYLPNFDVRELGQHLTDAWALTAMPATKVYPLADVLPAWVQPYGMFGVGVLVAHVDEVFFLDDATDATAAFRFSGGADFYLLPQLVARVSGGYVLGVSDLSLVGIEATPNFAPITVGLEFRF